MWVGETVVILASGPSMSAAVAEQVRAAEVPTIAINSTFRLAPWAEMLYAADAAWWQHPDNRDAHRFAGMKVSVEEAPEVLKLYASGVNGFDANTARIRTGGNSGYQAVHIAAHAGASRILLCGFDMCLDRGSHWHGDHHAQLKQTSRKQFVVWCERFKDLAKELDARGIDVVNCTPGSALKCFRMAALADELEKVACPAP
jgi:hypothetical protein